MCGPNHDNQCVDQIMIINVWTKYGEPRLYGNGETDLQALFMKITCKFDSQQTMKMRSRLGDTYMGNMYPS